jgi:hypothetical protein
MNDATMLLKPTSLRPLEKRPFGFGGGSMPLDLARWLRTHPVDRVEFAEKEGHVVLWSGRGRATTPYGHCLGIGPSKTIDGEKTLVTIPEWVQRQIDPIVEWERRNPEERPFGVDCADLEKVKICAVHLLGLPKGPERVGQVDRLLSLRPQNWEITRLREKLRQDPHDAGGSSATAIAEISKITDL